MLLEVLTHRSTLFVYVEMSWPLISVKSRHSVHYNKEISDKKQQDLCLYNEEDISSLQDGTNYYTLPFFYSFAPFQI